METTKANILVNAKNTPSAFRLHQFQLFILVDIRKASSHQFDFGDINNKTSSSDTYGKYNYTGDYGNDAMIPINLSNRYKISTTDISKVLYSSNPYSTQQLKKITIDVELHQQVNN